jgi:hypothetical protein
VMLIYSKHWKKKILKRYGRIIISPHDLQVVHSVKARQETWLGSWTAPCVI